VQLQAFDLGYSISADLSCNAFERLCILGLQGVKLMIILTYLLTYLIGK